MATSHTQWAKETKMMKLYHKKKVWNRTHHMCILLNAPILAQMWYIWMAMMMEDLEMMILLLLRIPTGTTSPKMKFISNMHLKMNNPERFTRWRSPKSRNFKKTEGTIIRHLRGLNSQLTPNTIIILKTIISTTKFLKIHTAIIMNNRMADFLAEITTNTNSNINGAASVAGLPQWPHITMMWSEVMKKALAKSINLETSAILATSINRKKIMARSIQIFSNKKTADTKRDASKTRKMTTQQRDLKNPINSILLFHKSRTNSTARQNG